MTQVNLTDHDWQQTPGAVQEAVAFLVGEVNRLNEETRLTTDQILHVYLHGLLPRTPRQMVLITPSVGGRQYKYARALQQLGWEIILIHEKPPQSEDLSCFSQVIQCTTPQEVLEQCLKFTPTVYHIFASWKFDLSAYLISSKLKPIVFDDYDVINGCIDTTSPEAPPAKLLQLERYCLENAHALTPRDTRMHLARRKHGLKYPPLALCIDGCMTQVEAQAQRLPKRTDGIHTVYIGNLVDPDYERSRNFHFELARVLSQAGIHYHLYPSTQYKYDLYKEPFATYSAQHCKPGFAHLHEPVPVNRVIQEISQYHFGIDILSTGVHRQPDDHAFYSVEMTDHTADNKVYDYICAGLFTFVHQGRWCRKVLERYGFGARVHSLEDIVEQAKKRYLMPLPPIPEVLTTKHSAERLIKLYESL
ncbi:MAG: hypothetical protein KDD55_04170 [Bdellovibrionales bacterium]|nr:hypothetical protein [Bdellovibrionales bacterium]